MSPPRGLIQTSDTIYNTPNVARTNLTICTGLKVGRCPDTQNKQPPFLSNIPYVHLYDSKITTRTPNTRTALMMVDLVLLSPTHRPRLFPSWPKADTLLTGSLGEV